LTNYIDQIVICSIYWNWNRSSWVLSSSWCCCHWQQKSINITL